MVSLELLLLEACLCSSRAENQEILLLLLTHQEYSATPILQYSYYFIHQTCTAHTHSQQQLGSRSIIIMGKSNQHPVIVEGTAVSASPYDHHTTTTAVGVEHGHGGGGVGGGVGEKQATRCRDPAFAFLLYGNVGAIAAVAAIYGADAFTEAIGDTTAGENSESGYSYTGYMYATFILGAIAMVFTGITLPIMMCIPTLLIKVSLLMMLVLSGLMMAYMFVSGSIIGGIIGVSKTTTTTNLCSWKRKKGGRGGQGFPDILLLYLSIYIIRNSDTLVQLILPLVQSQLTPTTTCCATQ